MAKKVEKKELDKQNWINSFNLLGEARINDNSFKLNQQSEKSDWIYSRANLGIYCGEDAGTVFAQVMGGYGANRENVIYVHGKKESGEERNGKPVYIDDWDNRYTIAFEDRKDEDILADIGDQCFYTVAIEKDTEGKLVYMKFLSQYDMCQYLAENIEDGMTLSVSGNLSYQEYEGNVNVQKEITKVVLISDPKPENYHAEFVQTILVDGKSKGDVDKDKGVIYINGYVLEYFKEYNGVSLATDKKKGALVPLNKTFEYKINLENKELTQKAIKKLFVPKKGVTQITFHGEFCESGATVQATIDDLPDEIKELITCGIYTEEEALAECATNGSKERRMILTRPYVKKVKNDDDTVSPILQMFENKYSNDDLLLDCIVNPAFTDADEEEVPFNEDDLLDVDSDDESTSWLDEL